MEENTIHFAITKILNDADLLISTAVEAENEIQCFQNSEFFDEISLLHERFTNNMDTKKLDYKQIISEITERTIEAKSFETKWILLKYLVYAFIPESNPSKEECKLILDNLREMTNHSTFSANEENAAKSVSGYLIDKLIGSHPVEVVTDFLVPAPVDVQIVLLKRIHLGHNFVALKTYLKGMIGTIKDVCNGPKGDIYGPSLVKFLTSYEYCYDDPDDRIIEDFYKKIIPQLTGKLRDSSSIRRIISFAVAMCAKRMEPKLTADQDELVDEMESNFFVSTCYVLEKALKHSVQLNIKDFLDKFDDKYNPPVELMDKIKTDIIANYEGGKDILVNASKRCRLLFACDKDFSCESRCEIVNSLIEKGLFDDAIYALSDDSYNNVAAESICKLIDNGLSFDKVLDFCKSHNERIAPTITGLIDEMPKYNRRASFYVMIKLLLHLFDYLHSLEDKIKRKIITELNFASIDALCYLLLLDKNDFIHKAAIRIVKATTGLFIITHPNWKTNPMKDLSIGALVLRNFEEIVNKKPVYDVNEMFVEKKKELQFDDAYDINDFFDDKFCFTCKLCSLQIKYVPELKQALEKLLTKVDSTKFSPERFAIMATTGIGDVAGELQTALDNIDMRVIVGISNISKALRERMLKALNDAKCSSSDKITIISFTLQNMISTGKMNVDPNQLNTAFDVLMNEYDTVFANIKKEGPISQSWITFAYAAIIILQNMRTLNNKRAVEKIIIYITSNGIRYILENPYYMSGNEYHPELSLLLKLLLVATKVALDFDGVSRLQTTFKRLSHLSDIQPGPPTFNEICTFFDAIKEIKPALIEESINSFIPSGSEQSIVIFATLALKYANYLTAKTNMDFVLFAVVLSNNLGCAVTTNTRELLKKVAFNGKLLNVPEEGSLVSCLIEQPNDALKRIISSAVTLLTTTKSLKILEQTYNILREIVGHVTVESESDLNMMFRALLTLGRNESKRRAAIRNIFMNTKNPLITLIYAMFKLSNASLFDEETWNAFSIADPMATFMFIYSCLSKGTFNTTFFYILNDIQMKKAVPEAVIYVGYTELLKSSVKRVFGFANKRMLEFANEKKHEELIDILKVNSSISIDYKRAREIVISMFPEQELIEAYSHLLFFNLSQEFVDTLLNQETISDEVFLQLKIGLVLSIIEERGEEAIPLFLTFAKKFERRDYISEAAMIFMDTDSKTACQACIAALDNYRPPEEFIGRLPNCIARGLLDIKLVSEFMEGVEYNNEALSFWLQGKGTISADDLRFAVCYGDEAIIDALVKGVDSIDKETIDAVAPLLFSPDKIEFTKVLPFISSIPEDKLAVPESTECEIPQKGKSLQSLDVFVSLLSIAK